uniref:Uncharacterized protein n=1 Tax=viral metagenome TaxID=1070528 RepID=A0A6C0KBD5_9ZZZZ
MKEPQYSSVEIHAFGNTNTKQVKLSQYIVLPKNVYPRIGITNFLMPNSMYNIQRFRVYADGVKITIPTGYYTTEQLTETFAEHDLVLAYSTVSLRFVITGTFSSLKIPVDNYLGVGGTATETIGSVKYYVFGSGPVAGTSFPNLAGEPNIFIRIEGLNYNTVNHHDAIARVPVGVCNGEYINYIPTELVHYLLTNQSILTFVVVLQDAEGNPLDINGANWSMTMSMHFDYRPGPPLNFPNSRGSDGGMMGSARPKPKPKYKKKNLI